MLSSASLYKHYHRLCKFALFKLQLMCPVVACFVPQGCDPPRTVILAMQSVDVLYKLISTHNSCWDLNVECGGNSPILCKCIPGISVSGAAAPPLEMMTIITYNLNVQLLKMIDEYEFHTMSTCSATLQHGIVHSHSCKQLTMTFGSKCPAME